MRVELVHNYRRGVYSFCPTRVCCQTLIPAARIFMNDRVPRVDHFADGRELRRSANSCRYVAVDEAGLNPVDRRTVDARPRLAVCQKKIQDEASHQTRLAVLFPDLDPCPPVSPEAAVVHPTEQRFDNVMPLPGHELHGLARPLPPLRHRDERLEECRDTIGSGLLEVIAVDRFGPWLNRRRS